LIFLEIMLFSPYHPPAISLELPEDAVFFHGSDELPPMDLQKISLAFLRMMWYFIWCTGFVFDV